MIRFPADHPIGQQQRANLREKLFPAVEREKLVRLYGELVLPALEKLLDAKVEELGARYEKSWHAFGKYLRDASAEPGAILVSREEAAEMLGVSLSSIQRLEERGELPQPKRFGKRTVRHRIDDVFAFARSNGLSVHTPSKQQ